MTIKQKIAYCLKIYGLSIVSVLVFGGLSKFLFHEITTYKKIPYNEELLAIFGASIIAPIIEELIFRFILIDFFNKKRIVFTSFFVFSSSVYLYLRNHQIDIRYFVFFTWICFIWSCYFFNKKHKITQFNNFRTIIISVSSLLFSVGHLESYAVVSGHYSYLFQFANLFCVGLLLSKVRIKIGLQWSMFTHFLINLMPSLALLYLHFYHVKH
jgi:membrane protease YdiL (CAAX protease family)